MPTSTRSRTSGPLRGRTFTALALIALTVPFAATALGAQQPYAHTQGERIDLTMERLLELTLSSSYQVRFLNMSVEQTQLRLRAERAGLRSNVSLDISAPQFRYASEPRWNSNLGRFETVRENSRHWEAELSVRQPVILFGYPTNGYLSLNNRMYRDDQRETNGDTDVTFYNRYFVRYTQPLFQPNGLKNSLEGAELDFEDAEIDYNGDMMEIVDDVADEFMELFETVYEQEIRADYIANLQTALGAAQQLAASDPARAIEQDQIRVAVANAQEQLQSSQSRLRIDLARMRTELDLSESVEISIEPEIDFRPVQVDVEEATRYALDLTPRLRQLAIQKRQGEMRFEQQKSRGAFRMDVGLTYGRERRDEFLSEIFGEPENTYTVDVSAYVPIWDWGQRSARIQADEIGLRRTDLQIEQAEIQIVSNIQNEVRNLVELQDRVIAMQNNRTLAADIAQQSLERYRQGTITALDLLQSLRGESDTAENYLDAYSSWRRAIQQLQQMTYWDFETGQSVLQRYGIDTSTVFGGS